MGPIVCPGKTAVGSLKYYRILPTSSLVEVPFTCMTIAQVVMQTFPEIQDEPVKILRYHRQKSTSYPIKLVHQTGILVYFIAPERVVSLLQQCPLSHVLKSQIQTFMKTMLTTTRPESSYDYSGLHELADFLSAKFKPAVASNKSFFINEIPAHLELIADKQLLASILNGLLSVVVSYTKNSCIRLSAKEYGNMVVIQVKESISLNSARVENEVCKLQPLAEKMRGSIGVASNWRKLTTITFGFPNLPLN